MLTCQELRIFLDAEAVSHQAAFGALCYLDRSLRAIMTPKSMSLLCRTCLASDDDDELSTPGLFSLDEPLSSAAKCAHGHSLDPREEQVFSGISRDFEEFTCPSHTSTSILGGTMVIKCQDTPMTVKARIARFEDFNDIAKKLSDNNQVENIIVYPHS